MLDGFWILIPLLFLVSLAYSSAGLGGGSAYIALLYFFGVPLTRIPPISLFFNIIASSVALYKFNQEGYFVAKIIIPFLLTSIPAAFFGASLNIQEKTLSVLVAAALLVMALLLLVKKKEPQPKFSLDRKTAWLISLSLGVALGFLAGIIGIGGGIFLGPVLLFIGMATSKQAATACSAFVLVNSASGLFSHILQGRVDSYGLLIMGVVIFLGAQVGSFLGAKKLSPLFLQRIFALLLLVASVKLGLTVFE